MKSFANPLRKVTSNDHCQLVCSHYTLDVCVQMMFLIPVHGVLESLIH